MSISAQNVAIPYPDAIAVPRKIRLYKVFLAISQFLTWPIAAAYFHTIYDMKFVGRKNFDKVSSPFIIIANHVTATDSFLFRLILGYWTQHLPLRFMAVTKFDYAWLNFLAKIKIIELVYKIFGVFTVVPGLGQDKNLQEAKRLIRDGYNLVIYPEGGINREKSLKPFKLGTAVLSNDLKCPVVPVFFDLSTGEASPKKLIIKVGEPISPDRGMNPQQLTDLYLSKITQLSRS